MPIDFKSSDTVYMTEIPDIVSEAFDMNQCQQSMENYDYLTTVAAGLLEGCSLQELAGVSKKEDCVGDNWHKGMLEFLGAEILPMIRTA